MAHRNITVDGVQHRYTIGRSHVKVHRFNAVPLATVGKMRDWPEYCCEYHCMVTGHRQRLSVQLSDVAEWIQAHRR